MEVVRVKTGRRTQFVDVTAEVARVVAESGVAAGVCYVFVPHTTARSLRPAGAPQGAVPARGREHGFSREGGDSRGKSNDFGGKREIGVGDLAGSVLLRVRWTEGEEDVGEGCERCGREVTTQ